MKLPDAALVYLIAICLVIAIGLFAGNRDIRCVRCGRGCACRKAGGTVDAPVCVECVRRERP